jgi:hypothetical protein
MYKSHSFASGGIVAFDDGGEVPSFADSGRLFMHMMMGL